MCHTHVRIVKWMNQMRWASQREKRMMTTTTMINSDWDENTPRCTNDRQNEKNKVATLISNVSKRWHICHLFYREHTEEEKKGKMSNLSFVDLFSDDLMLMLFIFCLSMHADKWRSLERSRPIRKKVNETRCHWMCFLSLCFFFGSFVRSLALMLVISASHWSIQISCDLVLLSIVMRFEHIFSLSLCSRLM